MDEISVPKCTFAECKLTKMDNINIYLETITQQLENEASYKYLGVEEGDPISHNKCVKQSPKNSYIE